MQQCRPVKGKGERFLECRLYGDCLDLVETRSWKNFNCEQCDFYNTIFSRVKDKVTMSEGTEKPTNTRICRECDKNVTIQLSSPFCAHCLALRAKESRAKKKETVEDKARAEKGKQGGHAALRSRKGPTQTIGQPKIVNSRGDLSLTLNFGKYGGLLNELKELAEKEVRSIDEQVIYILKTYFDSRGLDKGL